MGELDLPEVETAIPTKCRELYHIAAFAEPFSFDLQDLQKHRGFCKICGVSFWVHVDPETEKSKRQ